MSKHKAPNNGVSLVGRTSLTLRCVCGAVFGSHSQRPPHRCIDCLHEGKPCTEGHAMCQGFKAPLTGGWATGAADPDPVFQAVEGARTRDDVVRELEDAGRVDTVEQGASPWRQRA